LLRFVLTMRFVFFCCFFFHQPRDVIVLPPCSGRRPSWGAVCVVGYFVFLELLFCCKLWLIASLKVATRVRDKIKLPSFVFQRLFSHCSAPQDGRRQGWTGSCTYTHKKLVFLTRLCRKEISENFSRSTWTCCHWFCDEKLVVEDFTKTGYVTSVGVAEVNKPPPPLVADEQTQSRETHHLQSRCFVCNVFDRWVHMNSARVCAFFIYFLVVVLSPNENFALNLTHIKPIVCFSTKIQPLC